MRRSLRSTTALEDHQPTRHGNQRKHRVGTEPQATGAALLCRLPGTFPDHSRRRPGLRACPASGAGGHSSSALQRVGDSAGDSAGAGGGGGLGSRWPPEEGLGAFLQLVTFLHEEPAADSHPYFLRAAGPEEKNWEPCRALAPPSHTSLPLPAPPHPSPHLLAPLCASLQTTCSQIQLGAVVTT